MRLVILGFVATASAVPRIAFPFNAQVPPAARILEPYSFQFAAATFGGSSNLAYTLVDAPSWLRLETQRTLTGTPPASEVGTKTFGIRASDDTGSSLLNCTLVVGLGSGPNVRNEAQSQLSGRLSAPGTLSLYPGDAFTQQFSEQTFSAGTSEIRAYYAILADRTPLPSWIGFNPSALSFFGVAPAVGNEALVYTVTIVASDIIGFSGAETTFTLRVGKRALAFNPQREEYNIDLDVSINLSGQVYLDSTALPPDQIVSATLFGPSWLNLDKQTLTVSGRTPADFTFQEASVTIQDVSGNLAEKTLIFRKKGSNVSDTPDGDVQFPNIQINNVTVTAGQDIDYTLPAGYTNQPDFDTTIVFDPPEEWLAFDQDEGQIRGQVPADSMQSDIEAVVTLRTASGRSTRKTFYINVKEADKGATSTTSDGPGMIGENPTGLPPETARLNARQVAGIVVGLIAAVVLLAILLAIWCQRRRKRRSSIDKSYISRPMPDPQDPWLLTTHAETAIAPVPPVETEPKLDDKPPQIQLDVPSSPMKTSAFKRSRMSTVSSLGAGENAVLADDNIPVWGQDRRHGLHDSYSAATRLSTITGANSAHTKRTTFGVLPNRHSRASVNSPLDLKSQEASHHALSFPADTSSSDLLSRTTTTTSRTPSRPNSVLIRPLSRIAMENRRSIRLVAPSESHLSRTSTRTSHHSTLDHRPLAERRQSFIRHRASSGRPSLLFTTASRDAEAPTGTSARPRPPARKTRSASSELQPPARNPRRLEMDQTPRVLSVGQPHIPGAVTPDGSSQYSTTSEEIGSEEEELEAVWVREAALPRGMRNWVVPGEGSPTPPPSERERARWRMGRRLGRDGRGELGQGTGTGVGVGSSPLVGGAEVIEPRGKREVLGVVRNERLSGLVRGERLSGRERKAREERFFGGSGGAGDEGREGGMVMKRVRERERREGSGKVFI
ncbi:hypothetical protein BDZ85DRAFT_303297 [Elsinoe ampelina]|uniref:Dystroglycan-type cadherin-like domain-containing protein n=1 Tax=Elsinoe ampelina TaxID=302913 RepID=A0A6A6G312_9PEZI|nr:hypothetical protein BDZ85DRAFT_303297 [Elsinoe ampelina]